MGRCNRKAIARQAVKDKVICSKVVKYLGDKIARDEERVPSGPIQYYEARISTI